MANLLEQPQAVTLGELLEYARSEDTLNIAVTAYRGDGGVHLNVWALDAHEDIDDLRDT